MRIISPPLLFIALAALAGPGALAREQPNAQLQALDDQLPGDLINDPANMGWNVTGKNMQMKALRDDAIPGGGAAVSVKVLAKGADPWDVQAQIPLLGGIESGQQVTVGFHARTVSAGTASGRGEITVRVQQAAAPYAGFIDKTLPIGPDWAFYEASAKATRRLASGEGVVALQLAGVRQEIEIGQLIVVANAASIVPAGGASTQGAAAFDGPPALPDALKDKGTLLVDPRKRDDWTFYGPGLTHAAGTSQVMGVVSIKAATAAAAAQPHEAAITIPLDAGVTAGDSLIIAVAARTNASDAADGAGMLGARVMRNADPWPGFGDAVLSFAPGKWQIVTIGAEATQDIPAGEAAIQLQFGGAKQDLDLGPVYVLKANPAP